MLRIILVAAALALAGCGDDSGDTAMAPMPQPDAEAQTPETKDQKPDRRAEPEADGTRVSLAGSDFGTMLFGPNRQAIYIFERDGKNRTNCYGDCAEAWPPVYTDGAPRAGKGVDASLLGSIERRDGRRQVTYAGQPLYYYAHEGPGQVLCHNVDLNGGLWWVVGPDGKRRP
jgi:predicted lipoprotein with Yx(FWY)xxD motif